jgi:hypothetical protein
MKIYFGTTTSQWLTYKDHYFSIRNYLNENGCVLPFDWLPEADKTYNTRYKERNMQEIYRKVIHGIDESDAVVIEYTVPNFSSSHQINYALLKRKPTLVMRLEKDNPLFPHSYLDAVQNSYLTVKEYSKDNYRVVLNEFLGLSKIEKGQRRYNIVLDQKQKYYLDWASVEYNKSRSQILRELVEGRIAADDAYKKAMHMEGKKKP